MANKINPAAGANQLQVRGGHGPHVPSTVPGTPPPFTNDAAENFNAEMQAVVTNDDLSKMTPGQRAAQRAKDNLAAAKARDELAAYKKAKFDEASHEKLRARLIEKYGHDPKHLEGKSTHELKKLIAGEVRLSKRDRTGGKPIESRDDMYKRHIDAALKRKGADPIAPDLWADMTDAQKKQLLQKTAISRPEPRMTLSEYNRTQTARRLGVSLTELEELERLRG